jgi:hypothetical protein
MLEKSLKDLRHSEMTNEDFLLGIEKSDHVIIQSKVIGVKVSQLSKFH